MAAREGAGSRRRPKSKHRQPPSPHGNQLSCGARSRRSSTGSVSASCMRRGPSLKRWRGGEQAHIPWRLTLPSLQFTHDSATSRDSRDLSNTNADIASELWVCNYLAHRGASNSSRRAFKSADFSRASESAAQLCNASPARKASVDTTACNSCPSPLAQGDDPCRSGTVPLNGGRSQGRVTGAAAAARRQLRAIGCVPHQGHVRAPPGPA